MQPTQSQINAPQNTQDLVEASTATVIPQLTRNTLLPAGDGSAGKTSKNPFISANVPLAHRVSEKVRKQIWANEYVDFSTLFKLQEMDGNLQEISYGEAFYVLTLRISTSKLPCPWEKGGGGGGGYWYPREKKRT